MTIKTLTIAAALALPLVATPVFASTQNDIQTCRVAFEAQSTANDIRLVFQNKQGVTTSKARTIILKAVYANGAGSFEVSCQLNKNSVVALNTKSPVVYASR